MDNRQYKLTPDVLQTNFMESDERYATINVATTALIRN